MDAEPNTVRPDTVRPNTAEPSPAEPGAVVTETVRTSPAVPHGPGEPAPGVPPVRRLLPPLTALAGVAAAFTYVGLVDPNENGHYPVCPLYGITGVYCPGCGGLRSAHAVAHGDLAGAFGANALAVAGYALFAVVWAVWVLRAWQGRPGRITLARPWWWALGALVLAFTVARNLPFGGSLAP
ncbi:DUF2752 domain-containing protein [Streptomyces sp. NPDC088725]|uniref:DUF2752 domain-containing protein n=1 Tax=Streptomyces sp. NPDC088725 TaxID=3365873 RepID=UPI003830A185